jgi:hypothetical protein
MDRAANELDRLDDSLALLDRDERVGLDEFERSARCLETIVEHRTADL